VADDAGQEGLAPAQPGDEVVAHLLLDRLRRVAAVTKLSDRSWLGHEGIVVTMRCDPQTVNLAGERRAGERRRQAVETTAPFRSATCSASSASAAVRTV